MENNYPSNIWFTVRWFTGYLIDLIITVGGIVGMVWTLHLYYKYPLTGVPLIPDWFARTPFVAFGISLGVFAAFMAGRQWVRAQYFTHVLPEVWNDTVQNFIKNAKKEERERNK